MGRFRSDGGGKDSSAWLISLVRPTNFFWNRQSNFLFPILTCNRSEELEMDKNRVAGGVKKVTGAIKEELGKAVGNPHLASEGKKEKAEGRAQSAVGHVKDAAREIAGKK
jgi:uncharacterized protein YjbJ (UPF0337 family)